MDVMGAIHRYKKGLRGKNSSPQAPLIWFFLFLLKWPSCRS